MKRLLTTITFSVLVGTISGNLKPVFTNNVVSHGFKSNQLNTKNINIQNENSGNPFITKIKTIDTDANVSSSVIRVLMAQYMSVGMATLFRTIFW